jgi:nucleoside-diphosphate-sugar epimerase
MKIFVSGANGFLGSALIKKLSKKHEVIAFVRKKNSLRGLEKLKNVKLAFGDIRDLDSIKKSIKDSTVVYHLAAAAHTPDINKKKFYEVNIKGTANILNACTKKIKHFIYAGTTAIYGNVKNDKHLIIDEKYPVIPASNYAKSKLMGERLVRGHCTKNKIHFTILRPGKIFGPGDMTMLSYLRLAKKGLSFTLGKGGSIFMPVYINDAAKAFALALTAKKKNQTYIIAGPEPIKKRDFIAALSQVMKKKPRKLKIPITPFLIAAHIGEKTAAALNYHLPLTKTIKAFRTSRRFSIEKARKGLRYYPKTGVELMIRKTAEWYKEEGFL